MATDQQKQDEQREREEKIIANVRVCTVPASDVVGNISALNAAALATKLEGDFYSASLLEALTCYFDVTLHEGLPGRARGIQRAPGDLHKYLFDAHKIGAESVEGVALLTGVKDVNDLVVIKAPQRPDADGLVHEYFVSAVCLNALRRRCPGFMYAFGAFRCSAPVIEGKKVKQWCTPTGPMVNYVVFEKIQGKAFEDLVPAMTLDQFLSYFIQVAINTQIAVHACSWTHYDLHAGNVLCREIEEAQGGWFWVPFSLAGGQMIYVKSDRLPTIIDYGRAHVKYEGEHYGYFDAGLLREDGLYPDKCRPLYDMYKLLGFALWSCLESDPESRKKFVSPSAQDLFRQLQPLFAFFRQARNYAEYLATVKRERETYYVYGVEITADEERNSSLQDMLAHVEQHYPDHWQAHIASSIGAEDLVVTCSGLTPEAEEGPCETPAHAARSIAFSVTKSKHVAASRAAASRRQTPEEAVQDVENTRGRLADIRQERGGEDLLRSVEYRDVSESNARSERLLRESYPGLRNELIERIEAEVAQLRKEGELYTGLRFDFPTSSSPTQNTASLRKLLQALESSHLNLIFAYVKQYVVDRATLTRLESMARERRPTDQLRFALPARLAKRITSDAVTVGEYLVDVTPLTSDGASLRRAMLDTIDLGL
jgi:hypothetical protein